MRKKKIIYAKENYLLDFIRKDIEDKKQSGKVGSVRKLTAFMNQLSWFDRDWIIQETDKEKILKFHNYLQSYTSSYTGKKLAINSIKERMQTLKGYVNKLIDIGLIQIDPFRKVIIPRQQCRKKALSEEQVASLLSYQTDDTTIQEAINIFKCMYFLHGIRISDFLNLKFSDIQGSKIFYDNRRLRKDVKNNLDLN